MVDIALLGSGGGMPMPERFLSALLINYRGRKILIDCGEGTQVSMRMLGWGFKSIDIICITHGHGDHIVGLPGLLATIGNSGRTEPLTIIGPEGIAGIIRGLRVIAPYLPYSIEIIENPKEDLKVNIEETLIVTENQLSTKTEDILISSVELEHSCPCVGYSFYVNRKAKFDVDKAIKNEVPKLLWNRLQKGEYIEYEGRAYGSNLVLGDNRRGIKISYITDTRPGDKIVEFIKGSNLFVCEGTYGEDKDLEKAIKNKHMTFREAAQLAYEGKVKELLLTHFSPAMTEPEGYINNATDVFENTIIGYDRFIKSLQFED